MRLPAIFSEEHPLYPALITFNVILTTFLAICSAVSTMIADSAIQGELALSDTQSIWLTTLYLLGINLTVPCGNWFAGRFGPKRMYTYGVFIFSIGSLFAAFSFDFLSIASARIIEGVGAGFIFPIGLSLIVQNLPKTKTALGINLYIAGAFGAGIGLGIPLSGFLTQFHSWRMIFEIIVVLSFMTGTSCWMTRSKIAQLNLKPFDIFGFLTFATFISTFLIALTMGPIPATDQGWTTPYILLFFALAAVSFILCLFIENRHPTPLFPLQLFKDPIFSVSLAAMFLLGMATFASVAISIQYMLNGLLYEKFVTAKIAAVYGITIGLVSVISSYLAKIIPIPILTFTGLGLLIFSYFYNNELSYLTGYTQVITISPSGRNLWKHPHFDLCHPPNDLPHRPLRRAGKYPAARL
jgi:MFS family permease